MTKKQETCENCGHDKERHKWFVQIGKHPKQFYYSECKDCPCKKFKALDIKEDRAEMHKPMRKLTKKEIKTIEEGTSKSKGCGKFIGERGDKFWYCGNLNENNNKILCSECQEKK